LLSFLELLKSYLRDVIYHYDRDIDKIGIWRWKEVTGHRRDQQAGPKTNQYLDKRGGRISLMNLPSSTVPSYLHHTKYSQ
jgi:hypothetical protein